MKRTALLLITIVALASCCKTSSPDGRAQLRDRELSQRIDMLEQKQIVILDSIRSLNEKVTQNISLFVIARRNDEAPAKQA